MCSTDQMHIASFSVYTYILLAADYSRLAPHLLQATLGPTVLPHHSDCSHPDTDSVHTALSRAEGHPVLCGLQPLEPTQQHRAQQERSLPNSKSCVHACIGLWVGVVCVQPHPLL